MSKLLTIVIPTYNMESYLHTCLSSLILPDESQMRLFETLVIIDGATDRSEEIAREYETKYPDTFRVIAKENGHYGSCINRGLKEAQGKYIKVLDADDHFDTQEFAEYLQILSSTDADCIFTDMLKVNAEDKEVAYCNYTFPQYSHFAPELLMQPTGFLWMHCITYRTELLQSIHYHQTEGIAYTDQEWLYLPLSATHHLYYAPIPVYRYQVGRQGQTVAPDVFKENLWQEMESTKTMITEYNRCNNATLRKDYLLMRLRDRCHMIYSVFFLVYNMQSCPKQMSSFDRHMKTFAPQIYEELGNLYAIPLFKYRYVRKWRNGYPAQLPLMTFRNNIKKLKNKLLR